jgi:hypothetical protein
VGVILEGTVVALAYYHEYQPEWIQDIFRSPALQLPSPQLPADTTFEPTYELTASQYDIHPLLDEEIRKYTRRGYRVVNQTANSAQLVRPKKFNCLLATCCLFMALLGVIIYLFYYMAKRDDVIYLRVVGDRVQVTKG